MDVGDQDDVDFESAASATNRWTDAQVVNTGDGIAIAGDTGITQDVAGTDENKNFAINIGQTVLVCLDIATWTAGTLDARVSLLSK